jgi:hypothetical protein
MRIGHLIEHHDRARGIFIEHIVEENVFQRLAFQHQTLMRRVLGHQAAQIDRLAVIDVEALGQFAIEAGDALARGPELAMHAIRVLERRLDRMAAPQADGALVAAPAAASALHATRAARAWPIGRASRRLGYCRHVWPSDDPFSKIFPPMPRLVLTGKAHVLIGPVLG